MVFGHKPPIVNVTNSPCNRILGLCLTQKNSVIAHYLIHGLHSEKPLFAINNRAFSHNKHLTIDLWQHSGLAWLTDNGVIVNTAIRLVQKT